jgi:flagellar basal-body rod protein FlgC
MGLFSGLNITGSALTAQRLRMDVVSSNMANLETTRGELVNGEWQPYKRKMVVLQEQNNNTFGSHFSQSLKNGSLNGVKAAKIVEDDAPFKLQYNPNHPDANEAGYVQLPNVDPLKEMVDLISATRSYEANITVLNASKGMYLKALEIGKG